MNISNDIRLLNKDSFIDFLNSVNSDFTPPLDKKINFSEYYYKVINKAKVIFIIENKTIIALMVYYDNLDEAQITLVAVRASYRGKGISYLMFESFFKLINKPINIITWDNNIISKNLYIKLGFIIKNRYINKYGISEVLMVKK